MIKTLIDHVPLPIKLEAPQNNSDGTDSDTMDDETTSINITNEKAKLKNLHSRDRSTFSRGLSSVMVANEKEFNINAATTSAAVSIGTFSSEMKYCGNLYILQMQARLIFKCSFCELHYADMHIFAKHLHDSHKLFTEPTSTAVAPPEQQQEQSQSVTAAKASIKTETDGLLESSPLDIQEPLESCGNIFVFERQKLFLICGYCESKYTSSELFSRHMRQQHQLLKDPINKFIVELKDEIKYEIITIDELATQEKNDDALDLMAVIEKGKTLNNDNLILMSNLSSCSNSNSSGVPPPQYISTEILTPEENLAKLQTATRSKRKLAKPTSQEPTNRRLRKTTTPHFDPPLDVFAMSLSRTSATQPKPSPKYLNGQPPSSPDSTTAEHLNLEQHSAQIAEIVNDIEIDEEQKHNHESEPESELESPPSAKPDNPVKKTPTIYNCDQCLKTFKNAYLLTSHQRTHTGEKPFQCNVCGKSFRLNWRLAGHAMRHRSEKAFKCDLCGHPMATKQELVEHQRRHNGDKRYPCLHCPKAFVRGSDLKIHVRIHTGEKPFKCEICQKAFRANQNLIVHRKIHSDEKPFKCDYCEKHFMCNRDRKVHHRTHTGEKPFKCEICHRAFSSNKNLGAHVNCESKRQRKKPGPKPKHIKEEIAGGKQLSEELMVQVIEHKAQQPESRQKILVQAQQRAAAKTTLREQKRKNGSISSEGKAMQQVSVALKIALEVDDVANDVVVDSGVVVEKENDTLRLVVGDCVLQRKQRSIFAMQKESKTTSRRLCKTTAPDLKPPVAVVSKHIRSTLANKPKLPTKNFNVQPPSSPESATTERLGVEQHSAPIAEIVNDTEINKEQKLNNETDPQPKLVPLPNVNPANQVKKTPSIFHCNQCLKTFTKATRLTEHQRMHTGEKPFKCYVCSKSFRVKKQYVDHAMRHRAEKAFKCDVCGHAMATKQDLVRHQRHHKGDKRYPCPHCPKAFVRGSDLKTHIRNHTGEKPFKCEICQRAFRANQNLIVHRKTHRDDKPFKCDYCDKHFLRTNDRKVHHRTHTGEKSHKCELCDRAYTSSRYLRAHFNRDHVEGARQRKKPGPKPKNIKTKRAVTVTAATTDAGVLQ